MLKKFIILALIIAAGTGLQAQDNVYPAGPQKGTIVIKNGNIYTANGNVINNGVIVIKDGKIAEVGSSVQEEAGATLIDAKGKNVYPGLILPNTDLGISEIGSGVRGSNDYFELGEYNPSVRSVVAYNTDSKIINTLRANGILLACVAPQGRLVTGTSSIVQLDAWTWQDAIYKADNGLHINIPLLMRSPRRSLRGADASDPVKTGIQTVEEIESFFLQAQAYLKQAKKEDHNLKFEALRPLFEKKQKLFVHADIARQILVAVDFAKKFNIDVVLVGGSDSYLFADLLKQNNIAVILNSMHSLPTMQDDDIDQPYKTPGILQKAGVLFAINDNSDNARYRNLDFNAGTAAGFGLTREQALAAITINPARILGIDQQTGSIEKGKDANIIICEGDVLDMRTSIVTDAFIQGRKINLDNKQQQLYERYKHRYNIN
jgi:imidazolonepropionase-like amidohydrolase